jgi:hypothetical protein
MFYARPDSARAFRRDAMAIYGIRG